MGGTAVRSQTRHYRRQVGVGRNRVCRALYDVSSAPLQLDTPLLSAIERLPQVFSASANALFFRQLSQFFLVHAALHFSDHACVNSTQVVSYHVFIHNNFQRFFRESSQVAPGTLCVSLQRMARWASTDRR